MSKLSLRPAQEEILEYRSGKMAISAVPGSGKTWTLALLAAQIVSSGQLSDDQEVLIVTLVNSAVDNFYRRVSLHIQQQSEFPYMGYRVRTLHGLSHDIVRERPELAHLDDQFQIIDEREAIRICDQVTQAWLRNHSNILDDYLSTEIEEDRREWVLRNLIPEQTREIALSVIRYAKDMQFTPERLKECLDLLPIPLPLAEMGCEVFSGYQRALSYRGAVDFDDLIRLALQALESDPAYLERLRYRWPYILEDEAQDSSQLQEQILDLLVGEDGNWVRVGDPNQAIYETFTTADPRHFRSFLRCTDVLSLELPNSGRSTSSIIELANYLVDWTQNEHPVEAARDALQSPPQIEITPTDDPQPNPIDDPTGIHLVSRKYTPQEEIQAIANSLTRWIPEHQDWTVAVLTPRNTRAFELVDEIERRGIPFVDGLLRSSSSTRSTAEALSTVLNYLSEPGSASKLSKVYKVWTRDDNEDQEAKLHSEQYSEELNKIRHVERFIWPGPEGDWLSEQEEVGSDEVRIERLRSFRQSVRRWQSAILLPVDQLILTLAQDLFNNKIELALSHKLAVLLRQTSQVHPSWRLPELSEELDVIARNERRFIGFGEEDIGFNPDQYKGKVVVSTVHKAKGLEWDRVYLLSVNNYDFPSGQEHDQYIAEKWYLRDKLNLEAESLTQLEMAFSMDEYKWLQEGEASKRARLDYVRERLRLLYVGITRARKELIVTWNNGRKGNLLPASPLQALIDFWESKPENVT